MPAQVAWLRPEGAALDLTDPGGGLLVQPGVEGFGAAPRTITRAPKATGGALARWSYSGERLLTLPVAVYADTTEDFLERRRRLTLAIARTAPAAGPPEPGLLRVTRSDGSWREISCIYLEGLAWTDDEGRGRVHDIAVIQLVAPDPWWYGAERAVLRFEPIPPRNYLAPYETVSPDRTIGDRTVNVAGDAPVSPVWTITGPAVSVTVRYADTSTGGGPGWTYGLVDQDETITIDVAAGTVTDQDGNNRVGGLSWPTSSLFELQPGRNLLTLSLTGGQADASAITLTYRPRHETA